LVGKMTKAGETLRLNTTLQDAENGEVLGRQQVEGEGEASLFTMVDELTRLVKEDFQLTEKEIAADFDRAVEQITTASTEAFNYYREGMKYQNQGDYSKSIPLMELAVAVDPDFAMAYRTLSAAYYNLGLTTEASEKLKKAFELRERVSERERYYIQADFFRQSQDDSTKAIQAYQKLLELYPDDRIGNNNLGMLYLMQEEWDKAIERLSVNVRNRTESYASYTNLSTAYFSKGMPDKALNVLGFYLDEIGENPHIRDNRAWIYIREGDLEAALGETEKIGVGELQMVPAIRGAVHQIRGELNQAEVEYLKLMDSKQPQFHNTGRRYLTNLYLLQGRFKEALRQCEQGKEMAEVLDVKDWRGEWMQNKAFVHLSAGEEDNAVAESKRLMDLAAESKHSGFKRTAYFIKGLAYSEKNDLTAARENAAGLMEMVKTAANPKLARLHYFIMGKTHSKEGRYSEALDKLRKAFALLSYKDGLSGMFLSAIAETLYQSGDLDSAVKYYKKISSDPAVNLNDGHFYAVSLYRLGLALEKKGEKTEAKAAYRRFINLRENAGPETPQVTEARRRLSVL
jgi:tetratricopeptide (TPR) repeat protein